MGRSEHQIRQGGQERRTERTTGAVAANAPSEHWRYARHLESLAAVSGQPGEAEAVAAVLRDPDLVMAESAVVTHLDRRAAGLLADEAFPAWAQAVGAALGGRSFAARRLREWTLLKAVTQGEPWSAGELLAASDWCQRTAAQSLHADEALRLLAAGARSRRVRNAAAQRLLRRAAVSS
ncbi:MULTISPECIES: hypothetical protein [unclassified Streptomyces]|uniref:hypothetical protein n=1 Tax=unclassified Streptomyces TaxID=2593676 RepID=UPI00202DDD6C|nr:MULTISPECIES: hypothetical protein [unclassified Streptomyces]MCM1966000.1 hypothetical protein [Streptomyces sp. G1]MCX5126657.1 hypothetical protein [Streptomyces sp. NBC_00347]